MAGIAKRRVAILGTRGLPSAHSGFESFVARLAPYLVERGWQVTVYCQDETGDGAAEWHGVRLVQIRVAQTGSLGSIVFDALATWRAASEGDVVLTMGYNTAVFSTLLRLRGRHLLFNMDGLEWQRGKWSGPIKAWFYINERLACWLAHALIADHPEIASHLATRGAGRKITMIPYCADPVSQPDPTVLSQFGLSPGCYTLVICRPEPENSVLEIVRAYAARPRGEPLIILGKYRRENPFHHAVLQAASSDVQFPGAIFDERITGTLRKFARLYMHGHTVGGTNPSLVEALAAPAPVLARDNRFNRWVAGSAAQYFATEADCGAALDRILAWSPEQIEAARVASSARYTEAFTPTQVLGAYEAVLEASRSP